MKQYRCYLYDPDAHTVVVHRARLGSDTDAVSWARELHAAHPEYPCVDVWHSDRLVWQAGGPQKHKKAKSPP